MEREISQLTTSREGSKDQLTTLERNLESEQRSIAERILREDPSIGASSGRFKKTLEEKSKQAEQGPQIQQRTASINNIQEQQRETQRRIEERQKTIRELHAQQEDLPKTILLREQAHINENPEVLQRTALLQRAEERLAEARKQLEALPEAMRVTPPPELLRTIEMSQRRISEIQRDIKSSQDRVLKPLIQKEQGIISRQIIQEQTSLSKENTQQQENQQQLDRLTSELRDFREKDLSRLRTEDPELQEIRRGSEEVQQRVQESPEVKTLRIDIQKRKQMIKDTEGEISRRTKQRKERERNMKKTQIRTENTQKETREIEKEQEMVDRGKKIVKPKVERKKAPKK